MHRRIDAIDQTGQLTLEDLEREIGSGLCLKHQSRPKTICIIMDFDRIMDPVQSLRSAVSRAYIHRFGSEPEDSKLSSLGKLCLTKFVNIVRKLANSWRIAYLKLAN